MPVHEKPGHRQQKAYKGTFGGCASALAHKDTVAFRNGKLSFVKGDYPMTVIVPVTLREPTSRHASYVRAPIRTNLATMYRSKSRWSERSIIGSIDRSYDMISICRCYAPVGIILEPLDKGAIRHIENMVELQS